MDGKYTINVSDWGGNQVNAGRSGMSFTSGEAMVIGTTDDNNGWYVCLVGIGDTGMYGESDDIGPFDTVEAAALEGLDMVLVGIENGIDVLRDEMNYAAEYGDSVDSSGKIAEIEANKNRIESYIRGQIDLLSVMTTTEVEKEFGLAEGSAKKAAQRGQIAARKAGDAWLIRRSDASKVWGGKVRGLALLLTSLTVTGIAWLQYFA